MQDELNKTEWRYIFGNVKLVRVQPRELMLLLPFGLKNLIVKAHNRQ